MPANHDEAAVRALHQQYAGALAAGNMDAVADCFTFPAAFKGFLEEVAIATDKASLLAIYQRLIAAAPKAQRTEAGAIDVLRLRPGSYTLTMSYQQFAEDGALIHEGSAVYCIQRAHGSLRICAVL